MYWTQIEQNVNFQILENTGMKKKGFTLIELLVVIAIIAMLLAILVPALKKAKSQARDLIDRTNLRSLGSAADLYLTQSKDRFFPYSTTNLWLPLIGRYVDNIEEIRFCAKTLNKIEEVKQDYITAAGNKWGTSDKPWLWNASTDPTLKYEMGSYGFNGWLYSDANAWVPAGDKDKVYTKRMDVRIPSLTPLFLDSNWVDGWAKTDNVLPATGYRYDIGDTSGGTTSTSIGRFILDRHGPMTTVVFADAHAETISHAKLWTLSWHRGSQPNFNPVIPKPIPVKR
jgi:prepilin-type N-terminal cleavage/methylation domain-containing protein